LRSPSFQQNNLIGLTRFVSGTLNKKQVLGQVRQYFSQEQKKGAPC
jgi:hypothetical protein